MIQRQLEKEDHYFFRNAKELDNNAFVLLQDIFRKLERGEKIDLLENKYTFFNDFTRRFNCIKLFRESSSKLIDLFIEKTDEKYQWNTEEKIFFYALSGQKHFVNQLLKPLLEKEQKTKVDEVLKDVLKNVILAYSLRGDFDEVNQYLSYINNSLNDVALFQSAKRKAVQGCFDGRNFEQLNKVLNIKILDSILIAAIDNLVYFRSLKIDFRYALFADDAAVLVEFFSKVDLAYDNIDTLLSDSDSDSIYNYYKNSSPLLSKDNILAKSTKIRSLMKEEGFTYAAAAHYVNLNQAEKTWLVHYQDLKKERKGISISNNEEKIIFPKLSKDNYLSITSSLFNLPFSETEKIVGVFSKEVLQKKKKRIPEYEEYQKIWLFKDDDVSRSTALLEDYTKGGVFGRIMSGSLWHHHVSLVTDALKEFKTKDPLTIQTILNYFSEHLPKETTKGTLVSRLLFIAEKTGVKFTFPNDNENKISQQEFVSKHLNKN